MMAIPPSSIQIQMLSQSLLPTLIPTLCFLVMLSATWFMTGLIWFVQVVHYPLFASVASAAVSESGFSQYASTHARWTTYVVAPVMLLEAGSTFLWCLLPTPNLSHTWKVLLALMLVGIWLSTAFLSVPCHHQLQQGFQPDVWQRLVGTNWIRTLLWSARSLILTGLLARLMMQGRMGQ
jgi:hypothetical protein